MYNLRLLWSTVGCLAVTKIHTVRGTVCLFSTVLQKEEAGWDGQIACMGEGLLTLSSQFL